MVNIFGAFSKQMEKVVLASFYLPCKHSRGNYQSSLDKEK